MSGRIEHGFVRRLAGLPADTRSLLLLAAAEPVGDPVLVWRAAGLLGIDFGADAPARSAGLLEIGSTVRFRHPLARSAIYRAASREDRRAVHGALADATDPDLDPDRGIGLAACRGREAETLSLVEAHVPELMKRGEGMGVSMAQWALGVLYNGLGRFEEAVVAAGQALATRSHWDWPAGRGSSWSRRPSEAAPST